MAFAEKLIDNFLCLCIQLYGSTYITQSVHGLRHLPQDCKRFGPAVSFSCFVFEDFNRKLCSSISSGNKPLQQMINRYNRMFIGRNMTNLAIKKAVFFPKTKFKSEIMVTASVK